MVQTATETPTLSLDRLQKAAAEAEEGPILIIGGPGSGKTRTLIGRILNLLKSGASPHTITYLTFNSRSADEARALIEQYTDTQHLMISTIHLYASTFLRQAGAKAAGISPSYTIWDQEQGIQILYDVLTQENRFKNLVEKDVRSFMRWRANNLARDKFNQIPPKNADWLEYDTIYDHEKASQNVLDLDDLIPRTVEIMDKNQDLRDTWRRIRSKHLMVDEFQDVSPTVYKLLDLMTGPTNSITVATDPNQAIYTWRGADIRLIQQFKFRHPNHFQQLLRINHRSTRSLTDMAEDMTRNQEMSGLTEPYQTPLRPAGPKAQATTYICYAQQMDEHVVRQATQFHQQGIPYDDMAFIYRRGNTSKRLGIKLTNHAIPFTVMGEPKGEANSETRTLVSMLRSAMNPHDQMAFTNTTSELYKGKKTNLPRDLMRNITRCAKDKQSNLFDAAQEYLPTLQPANPNQRTIAAAINNFQILNQMIQDPEVTLVQITKRAHNLLHNRQAPSQVPATSQETIKLFALAEAYGRKPNETIQQQLARFLETINNASEPQHQDHTNEDPSTLHRGINLSTIHAAKGLQWPYVWFIDATDEIIPGKYADQEIKTDKGRIEEAQRVFYVASTRATDRMFYCAATHTNGEDTLLTRFIETIAEHIEFFTVNPQISNEYIPDKSQNDLPEPAELNPEDPNYYDPEEEPLQTY